MPALPARQEKIDDNREHVFRNSNLKTSMMNDVRIEKHQLITILIRSKFLHLLYKLYNIPYFYAINPSDELRIVNQKVMLYTPIWVCIVNFLAVLNEKYKQLRIQ